MTVLSNPRHERFCQELAQGKTATEAYELAGFKPDDGNASKLFKRPDVQARVQEITGKIAEKVAEKAAVDKAWVIDRLVENADRAMQAKAVQGEEGQVIGEYRYEGSVANRALELIGKEFGMFVDRKEVGKPGEFSNLNDDDLDKFISERNALIGSRLGGERASISQAGVRSKSNGVH